jgi:hypothetical protein
MFTELQKKARENIIPVRFEVFMAAKFRMFRPERGSRFLRNVGN